MNETAGEVYTPPFYTYSLGGRIALMDAVLAELTCESENKCIYSACMHMCMCVCVVSLCFTVKETYVQLRENGSR